MIVTLRDRSKTLTELVDIARFYLCDDISIEEKAEKKFLTPQIREPLSILTQRLSSLTDFSEQAIEQVFNEILQERGLTLAALAQPVRVALTGSATSPGIYDVIAVLGKERTLKRLQAVLDKIEPIG